MVCTRNRYPNNGNTINGIYIPASIPESYELLSALAGLLTYSPGSVFPP